MITYKKFYSTFCSNFNNWIPDQQLLAKKDEEPHACRSIHLLWFKTRRSILLFHSQWSVLRSSTSALSTFSILIVALFIFFLSVFSILHSPKWWSERDGAFVVKGWEKECR
ncbi:hypothetical protein RJT34_17701 [Clitoria ternatea]|uniref:Uncharacterized protein n=1 Tax=Clitoria ternatea TaxID=43366 RepID=A0AAN9JCJ1_CLITE